MFYSMSIKNNTLRMAMHLTFLSSRGIHLREVNRPKSIACQRPSNFLPTLFPTFASGLGRVQAHAYGLALPSPLVTESLAGYGNELDQSGCAFQFQ